MICWRCAEPIAVAARQLAEAQAGRHGDEVHA
jgi:hypothetical protein